MLGRLGFHCETVAEQDVPDGRFPTVESPNPENADALTMAMKLADETGADLVVATDPDCDRMGIAARDNSGKMTLLTGNQIGSLMAWTAPGSTSRKESLPKQTSQRSHYQDICHH